MTKENKVLIDIKNATFAYGEQVVLKDVNVKVDKGAYTLLLGANGSGKSTFVKSLLGLMKPVKGEIFLFDEKIDRFDKWDKIGYVAQRAAHIEMGIPLSVFEVVSMGKVEKVTEAEVRAALKEVEMEAFMHEDVNKLSGGQQQRVFIARSLLSDPELLILDEPTVGLDAHSSTNFYELIATLHRRGRTILLVTHDTHFMTAEATNVLELRDGEIVFDGEQSDYRTWHNTQCHMTGPGCKVKEIDMKEGGQ